MRGVVDTESRERLGRWLEDGQAQLGAAVGLLKDYERIMGAAEAAEAELERLRGIVYENEKLRNQLEAVEGECGRLREAVAQLRAEGDRHQREREEIAASLSDFLNGVLMRLRPPVTA